MASIEQIAFYNTWAIRHKVLYPDQPFDVVRLEEDQNGIHFALFDNGKMVTVISTFISGDQMQFRKFATLPEFQGKGYGTMMLKHVLECARAEGIRKVWCNARCSATGFYVRFGFLPEGEHFIKNNIEYVVMTLKL